MSDFTCKYQKIKIQQRTGNNQKYVLFGFRISFIHTPIFIYLFNVNYFQPMQRTKRINEYVFKFIYCFVDIKQLLQQYNFITDCDIII